ncbi:thiol:disulfide interchange protein [Alistipes sp. An31A]|uniref:protein-disulfide reductase DsbD family protein n=1 Tax=Alistipes sp. An31A TaxID=1965631 RepID=UPI000B393A9C|nr:cytochrome c biogenesis protein CcdA [Alistipes sp. An31A]OUO22203.1 thiol:disulfide interchange protein [Alistipes sp. An31A]
MQKLIQRILLPLLALTLGVTTLHAQEVGWTGSVEPLGGAEYELRFEAAIPSGFHMYDMGPYEGGPNPTVITLSPEAGVELVGSVEQRTKPHRYFDQMFGMEIGTFSGKALFTQHVRLTAAQAKVRAAIEWMICDDKSCMPPSDTELTLVVGAADAQGAAAEATTAPAGDESVATPAAATERVSDTAATSGSVAGASETTAGAETAAAPAKDAAGSGSLWSLIIEAILWGFAALLTPCVFPMVPMTVSFFMKSSGKPALGRFRAGMYGFFIVALYTLPIAAIIVITRLVGGDAVTADIFNWLATHWLPNLIFFAVFMLFAASFFGAFEITMPSWMVNKSDSKADSKGLAGIFFMALTLVLVSFSCTGPIVGSVLIKSTAGEFWSPIVTMLAFSLAFALPFTLFAFFPSMLKKLPKSGGWLNSVKVVLGFVEVALGFKFLSVADQTYHWGLLDREVYLAIWIVVFAMLGFYLLGKLRFAHDDEVQHVGVGRLALAIAVFTFVVYLIPGMWGAPLKALSGYLPPLTTQDFVLGQTTSAGASVSVTAPLRTVDGKAPKYSDVLYLPHGLEGFFDLKEAEAYAARAGKPLFIDFTGHGCVNCREMEARVWSDPRVLELLRNDYVICALYSDDKVELPESEWVTTESGKVLRSLGKINAHYALKTFGVNAQPYYVLQGRDGRMLVEPRGYDLDVEAFVDFLRRGVEAYRAEEQGR